IKPFIPREAVARARAVLRRSQASIAKKSDIASFAGWFADFSSHSLISPQGQVSELSASEVKLLHSLISAPHRVLSRAALAGSDETEMRAYDRSIDVRVSRLRQKLGEDPRNPRIIKTIFGSGYMFTATVDWVDHLPEAAP
ncbi:MAG: winged helix-turn-helix domain-containing protein, partial [Mangrovicoccus sp.]